MSNTSRRRTAVTAVTAVLTLAAAGTSLAALAPAQAQAPTLLPSRISVHTTDTTPASGEQFVLSGAVWSQHLRVPATVRVKAFRNGSWHQLPGAVHETNRDNRYHLRITLQMPGERQLKVVGDPRDPTIATAVTVFSVTVH